MGVSSSSIFSIYCKEGTFNMDPTHVVTYNEDTISVQSSDNTFQLSDNGLSFQDANTVLKFDQDGLFVKDSNTLIAIHKNSTIVNSKDTSYNITDKQTTVYGKYAQEIVNNKYKIFADGTKLIPCTELRKFRSLTILEPEFDEMFVKICND